LQLLSFKLHSLKKSLSLSVFICPLPHILNFIKPMNRSKLLVSSALSLFAFSSVTFAQAGFGKGRFLSSDNLVSTYDYVDVTPDPIGMSPTVPAGFTSYITGKGSSGFDNNRTRVEFTGRSFVFNGASNINIGDISVYNSTLVRPTNNLAGTNALTSQLLTQLQISLDFGVNGGMVNLAPLNVGLERDPTVGNVTLTQTQVNAADNNFYFQNQSGTFTLNGDTYAYSFVNLPEVNVQVESSSDNVNNSGYRAPLQIPNVTLAVTLVPIPEPATYSAIVGLAMLAFVSTRVKRRAS
jgi:hypothetical protein